MSRKDKKSEERTAKLALATTIASLITALIQLISQLVK